MGEIVEFEKRGEVLKAEVDIKKVQGASGYAYEKRYKFKPSFRQAFIIQRLAIGNARLEIYCNYPLDEQEKRGEKGYWIRYPDLADSLSEGRTFSIMSIVSRPSYDTITERIEMMIGQIVMHEEDLAK